MERKEMSGAKRLLVQETKSLGMTPPTLFTITNVTHPASVTQPCCSTMLLLHFLTVTGRNDCPMDQLQTFLNFKG